MKNTTIKLAALACATLAAGTVLADHNSPMGEGWANMPNDIHNTRVETQGDNETFRDFVKQGAGADSVNRYADADTSGQSKAGSRARGKARDSAAAERKASREAKAAGATQQQRDRSRMRELEGRSRAAGPGSRSRSMGGAGRRGRH